ncbi:MAG: type VI secretion system-associated FHA domain protein TagH [Azoarcus sp.]|jgi:type VI secretion system FHA domain protein|nr:type VI secretion system-associated FHA domain protein TagH [Azoarcus sp.]
MLEIQALTYNDLPPVVPIAGTISGSGATIGRSGGNAVILPDPMHLVSRRHLAFSLEAGGMYRISNISGKNTAFVNGDELAPGQECTLQDRDKITLGGYVLQVRYAAAQPAAAAAPPALDDDLLASFARGADKPATALLESDDPLGSFMYGSADDRRDPMRALNERGLDLGSLDSKGDEPIDGEDVHGMVRELLSDPLADKTMDGQLARDANLDPLAMFDTGGSGSLFDDILQSGKGEGAARHMDLTHGSDIGGLFNLPEPLVQAPGQAPASPVGEDAPSSSDCTELIGDLSIDDLISPQPSSPPPAAVENASPPSDRAEFIGDLDGIDDLIAGIAPIYEKKRESTPPAVPSEAAHTHAVVPSAVESACSPANDAASSGPGSRPKPPPVETVPAAASPEAGELYEAFIEGLGIDLPGRATLDEAFMKTLGQMLRSYAQGTVDLIASRAIVKQEVRASVTLIAPERNNPLKFSSDGNAALLYLLGKPFPGFMGPVEAVQNAFTDLCAHQIGLVSGMRSTFNRVLQCFDPAQIGNNDPVRGLLDQAVPSQRKARLWDAYERYFAETQESVADRFQSFFGAAFVKAYEDAISALQAGEKAGKS